MSSDTKSGSNISVITRIPKNSHNAAFMQMINQIKQNSNAASIIPTLSTPALDTKGKVIGTLCFNVENKKYQILSSTTVKTSQFTDFSFAKEIPDRASQGIACTGDSKYDNLLERVLKKYKGEDEQKSKFLHVCAVITTLLKSAQHADIKSLLENQANGFSLFLDEEILQKLLNAQDTNDFSSIPNLQKAFEQFKDNTPAKFIEVLKTQLASIEKQENVQTFLGSLQQFWLYYRQDFFGFNSTHLYNFDKVKRSDAQLCPNVNFNKSESNTSIITTKCNHKGQLVYAIKDYVYWDQDKQELLFLTPQQAAENTKISKAILVPLGFAKTSVTFARDGTYVKKTYSSDFVKELTNVAFLKTQEDGLKKLETNLDVKQSAKIQEFYLLYSKLPFDSFSADEKISLFEHIKTNLCAHRFQSPGNADLYLKLGLKLLQKQNKLSTNLHLVFMTKLNKTLPKLYPNSGDNIFEKSNNIEKLQNILDEFNFEKKSNENSAKVEAQERYFLTQCIKQSKVLEMPDLKKYQTRSCRYNLLDRFFKKMQKPLDIVSAEVDHQLGNKKTSAQESRHNHRPQP